MIARFEPCLLTHPTPPGRKPRESSQFSLPEEDEEVPPHRPKHGDVRDGDQGEDDRSSRDDDIKCYLPLEFHGQQLRAVCSIGLRGIAAGTSEKTKVRFSRKINTSMQLVAQ